MNHGRPSIHQRMSSDFHTYGMHGIGCNRKNELRAIDRGAVGGGERDHGTRWWAIRLSFGKVLIAFGRWCAGAALDVTERAESPAIPQSV